VVHYKRLTGFFICSYLRIFLKNLKNFHWMNMPIVWQVLLWMDCFEEELQKCLRGVIRHPFFILFLKRWPKGGQDWDIKEKRFCIFAHLELLAKSLWCPVP